MSAVLCCQRPCSLKIIVQLHNGGYSVVKKARPRTALKYYTEQSKCNPSCFLLIELFYGIPRYSLPSCILKLTYFKVTEASDS